MPLFVRKFIVDAIETALAVVFSLVIAFPTSIDDAKKAAISIAIGVIGAVISAARRAIPGFLAYLNEKLNTGDGGGE